MFIPIKDPHMIQLLKDYSYSIERKNIPKKHITQKWKFERTMNATP